MRLGYENVYRFAEGLPKWKEMGLTTASGQIFGQQPWGIGAPGSALFQSGLFLTLLGVFLGGLALNLTPCVYPLIPITVSYFTKRKSAPAVGEDEPAHHGRETDRRCDRTAPGAQRRPGARDRIALRR